MNHYGACQHWNGSTAWYGAKSEQCHQMGGVGSVSTPDVITCQPPAGDSEMCVTESQSIEWRGYKL